MIRAEHIYFVGIGGIGMSALAQLFKHQGKRVSGSDREESPTTKLLAEKSIEVWIGHDQCHIPADTELLIYSDAVPADNVERARAREMKIPQTSYFEALGTVSTGMRTIAVAGTHGKTTTTGMLAAILKHAGKEPTAIVGSIVSDFGSNFLPGNGELLVVEACEYREHLLELSPEILVITNIELDHTDFFPSLSALQNTFRAAVERVPENGVIVANPSDPVVAAVLKSAKAPIIDYTTQTVPELELLGEFNAMNARAAKAAARAAFPHVQEEYTDKALLDFKGSWRRFEYKGETPNGALVYDDYAHHPTEIRASLSALRELYPKGIKKLTVVFQPHLYSRTKAFFTEFTESFDEADRIVFLPIYFAREDPDPSVSSEKLAQKVAERGSDARFYSDFASAASFIKGLALGENDVLVTMGAGEAYKVADLLFSPEGVVK